MHLWPSLRLRDSFGSAYLKKLEWNLHRMNTTKQRSETSGTDCGNQQKLLDDENDIPAQLSNSKSGGFILLCREVLMVLSCCYCCFCCGACVEEESSRRIIVRRNHLVSYMLIDHGEYNYV